MVQCLLVCSCEIVDARTGFVPLPLSTALEAVCFCLSPLPLPERLSSTVVCLLPFLIVYLLRDDLGGADVRFAAACGAAAGLRDGLLLLGTGLVSFVIFQLLSRAVKLLCRRQSPSLSEAQPLLPWLSWPWLIFLLRQLISMVK